MMYKLCYMVDVMGYLVEIAKPVLINCLIYRQKLLES